MDSISRRDFFTKAFTGVVIAGTGGKVLGQLVPRIIETESPDTIQVEFTIDLMLPEFADLTTEYSSISINDTGVTSAPIIVMRVPNEKFVALVDQCTHEGFLFGKCDMTTKLFTCSNHGSQFDENGICKRGPGGGPATLPRLESIPIVYDKANSKLYLNRVVRVDEISYDGFSIQCYPNPAVAETVFEFALENSRNDLS